MYARNVFTNATFARVTYYWMSPLRALRVSAMSATDVCLTMAVGCVCVVNVCVIKSGSFLRLLMWHYHVYWAITSVFMLTILTDLMPLGTGSFIWRFLTLVNVLFYGIVLTEVVMMITVPSYCRL